MIAKLKDLILYKNVKKKIKLNLYISIFILIKIILIVGQCFDMYDKNK